MALDEFLLIDPSLEEIRRLHTAEIQTFFEKTGVVGIFKEECRGIDLTKLIFSVNVGQVSVPTYLAGEARPLRDYYRYFLLAEKWHSDVVFNIDKDSLRTALRVFLKAHQEIKEITDIWVLPDQAPEQYKIDPDVQPDQGKVKIWLY
jgi:hypothetical protein